MNYKKYIGLFLLFTFFVSGCKKSPYFLQSVEKRLTLYNWRLDNAVDSEINSLVSFPDLIMDFNEDGSINFLRNDSIINTAEWELLQDDQYLHIGTNTYKITRITHKLLTLRYGTIDIYYLPVKE